MYLPAAIVEPQIVKQSFNGKEKECFLVDIEGEDYLACEAASAGKKFWGNSKPGAYGAGLGRTEDDKYKPARTGLLGQTAFAKLFNQPLDTVYREGGDKFDNKIGKYTYDIKCAMKNYKKGLIQYQNEFGQKNPESLSKDIYVFGYVKSEDREQEKATIVLVGFMLKADVEACEIKPGIRGNGHLNYEVPFGEMKSIVKLRDMKIKHYGG